MAKKTIDKQKEINKMVERLSLDGKALVEKAYKTRGFIDRTYNLHDSYGSAVYYNGVLQPNSIYYLQEQATEAKKWYGKMLRGRNEIVDFFIEYKGRGKGFDLVLVAAMPYASILEHGQGTLRGKYQVISGTMSDMRELARKYKGSISRTSTSRVV